MAISFIDADPALAPIAREMRRLFGAQWKPSRRQMIELADLRGDPAEIASLIEAQADDWRRVVAGQLGFSDWKLIALREIDDLIDLQTPTDRAALSSNPSHAEDRLSGQEAFDIGVRVASSRLGIVVALYRSILGREPDDPGFAFWRKALADGLPVSEVARHFEAVARVG